MGEKIELLEREEEGRVVLVEGIWTDGFLFGYFVILRYFRNLTIYIYIKMVKVRIMGKETTNDRGVHIIAMNEI